MGNSFSAAGYNFDSGGVTFGVDYKFSDTSLPACCLITCAPALTLPKADAWMWMHPGGAYASLFGGGAYVNGYLGGGYNDYDMRRAGLDSTVRGATDGGEFNALSRRATMPMWVTSR